MSDIFSNSELVSWFTNLNNALSILQLPYNAPSPELSSVYNPKSSALINLYISNIEGNKPDKYFSTANISTIPTVRSGKPTNLQTRNQITAADAIIRRIVCRNDTLNTNQTYDNGTNTQGTQSNGVLNNGTCSRGTNSVMCQYGYDSAHNYNGGNTVGCRNGSNGNGIKTNGTDSNAICSNGYNANGMNGASSDRNGVMSDYGNNWAGRSDSCGATSGYSATNTAGYYSNCNDSICNNGVKTNGTQSNGNKSNGYDYNGTRSNSCSDGVNSVGCNETCSKTCSQTCTDGTNSNGYNSQGTNSQGVQSNQYKTNGAGIDIFNTNSGE